MTDRTYNCSICGKPTRSHDFLGGRLVYCHSPCWEQLTQAERDNISNRQNEYKANMAVMMAKMLATTKDKKRADGEMMLINPGNW